MTEFLFIYGTLLSGYGHPMHEILGRYADLSGIGFINGKLYELGDYPGLVLSNNTSKVVWGEIYIIRENEELFRYLDEYEGCASHQPQPHEYRRDLVTIHDSPEHSLLAWTYLYKHAVTDLSLIPGGDYLSHRNKGRLKIVNQ
ncbi:MAG: gamma-glutamylcyclotransferase [Gammaproteobacteria bacterium]|nr:gamma-glutamylcyclotransferase [Gammaproteobacteria bacterium]